jgi:hypothetical protein
MTTKYFTEFSNAAIPELGLAAEVYKISFQFTGSHSPIELKAGGIPLKIGYSDGGDDIFSPIRAKKATIQLIATDGIDLDAFYLQSDRECLVLVERGSDVIFKGWLTAFDAKEPFISRPYTFELNAHCGLSSLKDFKFSASGLTSFNDAIKQCLSVTGLGANYLVGLDTRISGEGGDPTQLYGFEADAMNGKYCYDVLTHILDSFVGDVEQTAGKWHIRGLSEQAEGAVTLYEYSSGGGAVGSSSVDYSITSGRTSARRNVTGAELQKEPAISYVQITYDLGELKNLLENGSFLENSFLGINSFNGWDRYNGINGSKFSPSGIKIAGRRELWWINADGSKVPGVATVSKSGVANGPLFSDDKYYESHPIALQSVQKAKISGRFQIKNLDFARIEVFIYDSENASTTKLWMTKDGPWTEDRDFIQFDYTQQVVRVYGDDPAPAIWYPFDLTSQDIPTKRSASGSTNAGSKPYTVVRYNRIVIRIWRGVFNNTVPVSTAAEDSFVVYDKLQVKFDTQNEENFVLNYGFKNALYVRKNPIKLSIPFGGYSVATTGGAGRIRDASLNNYASVIRRMSGGAIVDAWTKAGQGVLSDFLRLNGISRLRLGHKFGYSWEGEIVGDYKDSIQHYIFQAQSGVKYKPTAYEYDFKNRIADVTLKQLLKGSFSYVEALEEGTTDASGAVANTITNANGKAKLTDPDAFTDRGEISEPLDFDGVVDNGEYRINVETWDGFENAPIFGGTVGRLRVFESEGFIFQYYYPEFGGVMWREYSIDEASGDPLWNPAGGWNIGADGPMLAESTDDEPEPKYVTVVDSYNRGIGSGMAIRVPTEFAFEKQSIDAFIDRTGPVDPTEVTTASNFNAFTSDGGDYLISLSTWTGSTNAPTALAVGGRLTTVKDDGKVIQTYQSGGAAVTRTRQKKNKDGTYTWTAWVASSAPISTFENDFNELVEMGAYHIATAGMPSNAPDGADAGGMLHVFITDGELKQLYYVGGGVYFRSRLGGTWTDWNEGAAGVMFDTEASPAPDTVEVTTEYIDGIALAATVPVYTKDYIDDLTTTDIPEPASDIVNKYFTNARARAALSAGTGISYNPTTGEISWTGTTTAISAIAPIYYNGTTGALYWGGTTADVPEGGGYLYYTDARSRAALSAGTGISYNSTTGVITATVGSYSDAQARAAISVAGGVLSYNSTTGVITLSSTAYDSRYSLLGHTHPWSAITSTPTTLVGYGITNAYTKTEVDALIAGFSGLPSGGTTAQYLRGDRSWQTLNTTVVPEGTNLYYTDPRARAALSAGTGIAYSFVSGIISSTISQYTDALARAAISAGTGLAYNSSTGVMSSTITQYTDPMAKAAISVAGGVLSYSFTSGVITLSASAYDGRYSLLGHLHDDRYVQLAAFYTNPSWLVSIPWSKITDRPNTIAGYGITNAYTKTEVDALVAGFTGLPSGGLITQYLRGDNSWQTLNTTAVPEGTNLYFTNTRARNAISGGTGISYDAFTGIITNTVSAYTNTMARAAISATAPITYNSTTGVIGWNGTTSDVPEGSRLYYTDTRVQTYGDGRYSLLGHTHNFTLLVGKPTTLAGYGITDATSGSGTVNYVARWTGSTSLGTGLLTDDGTNVTVGAVSNVGRFSVAGAIYASSNDNAVSYYLAGGAAIRAFGTMYLDAYTGDLILRAGAGYTQTVIAKSNGQVRFPTYNSSSSWSGTAAGLLGFDSSGNILTVSSSSFAAFVHNHDGSYYTKTQLNTSGNGGAVHWDNVTNKPSSYNPSYHRTNWSDIDGAPSFLTSLPAHDHDDRYYTKGQLNTSGAGGAVHWDNVTNKPGSYNPSYHRTNWSDIDGAPSFLTSESDPFGLDSHWFSVSGSTVTLGIQRRNGSQVYSNFNVPASGVDWSNITNRESYTLLSYAYDLGNGVKQIVLKRMVNGVDTSEHFVTFSETDPYGVADAWFSRSGSTVYYNLQLRNGTVITRNFTDSGSSA